MKSLVDHMTEQEDLEERLLRTGAIATYGARSRKEGEDSVRAFKQGQQALRKGIKQRQQIGAGVAVDVAGHMLAAKARKQR